MLLRGACGGLDQETHSPVQHDRDVRGGARRHLHIHPSIAAREPTRIHAPARDGYTRASSLGRLRWGTNAAAQTRHLCHSALQPAAAAPNSADRYPRATFLTYRGYICIKPQRQGGRELCIFPTRASLPIFVFGLCQLSSLCVSARHRCSAPSSCPRESSHSSHLACQPRL